MGSECTENMVTTTLSLIVHQERSQPNSLQLNLLLQNKQDTVLQSVQMLSHDRKQSQYITTWFTVVAFGAATHAWYSTNRLAFVIFACVKLCISGQ